MPAHTTVGLYLMSLISWELEAGLMLACSEMASESFLYYGIISHDSTASAKVNRGEYCSAEYGQGDCLSWVRITKLWELPVFTIRAFGRQHPLSASIPLAERVVPVQVMHKIDYVWIAWHLCRPSQAVVKKAVHIFLPAPRLCHVNVQIGWCVFCVCRCHSLGFPGSCVHRAPALRSRDIFPARLPFNFLPLPPLERWALLLFDNSKHFRGLEERPHDTTHQNSKQACVATQKAVNMR